jgi:hypothetical protein
MSGHAHAAGDRRADGPGGRRRAGRVCCASRRSRRLVAERERLSLSGLVVAVGGMKAQGGLGTARTSANVLKLCGAPRSRGRPCRGREPPHRARPISGQARKLSRSAPPPSPMRSRDARASSSFPSPIRWRPRRSRASPPAVGRPAFLDHAQRQVLGCLLLRRAPDQRDGLEA